MESRLSEDCSWCWISLGLYAVLCSTGSTFKCIISPINQLFVSPNANLNISTGTRTGTAITQFNGGSTSCVTETLFQAVIMYWGPVSVPCVSIHCDSLSPPQWSHKSESCSRLLMTELLIHSQSHNPFCCLISECKFHARVRFVILFSLFWRYFGWYWLGSYILLKLVGVLRNTEMS